MTAPTSPTGYAVHQLRSVLGSQVQPPGTTGYEDALARVFFPDAARRRPSCVVAPRSVDDVATVLRVATASASPVTVRGGGLSSTCVADGAIMMDLSAHLDRARPDEDRVVMDGGATVATMLDALAPAGRVVPVGIVGHAGLGLATRGGVGYLTRSLGLTLDHLVGIELVLPSGEVVHLSEASAGEDADLWWAVRGGAPYLGVVTSAKLRTHEIGPVWVDRLVVGLDAIATYFRVAPELPRDTTMGAILGYSSLSPKEPVLFVYTACASQDSAVVGRARATTSAVAAGSSPLYRSETAGRYLHGLPEFAIPGADGAKPAPIRLPHPGDGPRGSFFGKSSSPALRWTPRSPTLSRTDPRGAHPRMPHRLPAHRWRPGRRQRRRNRVLGPGRGMEHPPQRHLDRPHRRRRLCGLGPRHRARPRLARPRCLQRRTTRRLPRDQ